MRPTQHHAAFRQRLVAAFVVHAARKCVTADHQLLAAYKQHVGCAQHRRQRVWGPARVGGQQRVRAARVRHILVTRTNTQQQICITRQRRTVLCCAHHFVVTRRKDDVVRRSRMRETFDPALQSCCTTQNDLTSPSFGTYRLSISWAGHSHRATTTQCTLMMALSPSEHRARCSRLHYKHEQQASRPRRRCRRYHGRTRINWKATLADVC